ncbi:unnamed protein product [Auanema sp. JU1783]|nr:unnamed protein product [Auanema sp. JU1783]
MTDSLGSSNQQLLLLKVMRLGRHKLNTPPLFFDPNDPEGLSKHYESSQEVIKNEKIKEATLTDYVVVPHMFENVYLGETFSFYVHCVNESDQRVTDVSVTCELQTNSQRVSLSCSLEDKSLEAGEAIGQVLSHEIKELGQHIVICSVNYKTVGAEKMYFRKFFKFPVTKPIDVKTKFYNTEDSSNNDVYLEAQIENTSGLPMILEKVELDPSAYYEVTPIRPSFAEQDKSSKLLRPSDIRQFLFCLSNRKNQNLACYKDMTVIGKLDMSWRTSMGEKGRLQTSSLQRIAPGYGDVRLAVEELPATVNVRELFKLKCRVYNCSERALDLTLALQQNSLSTYVFCSVSGLSLGQLPPNASFPFSLEILPVAAGFQAIGGIRLIDSNMKRTYEHDDIAQVLVL